METPELNKISKVKDKSQTIGQFLDWLIQEKGYCVADWKKFDGYDNEQLVSVNLDINKILEEYFEIDGKKAEEERQGILQEIRSKK